MIEKSLRKFLLSVGCKLINSHRISILRIIVVYLYCYNILIKNIPSIDTFGFSLELHSKLLSPLFKAIAILCYPKRRDKINGCSEEK